jgi:hypothetical protein
VAVATGSYTTDQLAGADAVVSEIAQLPGALAELGFAPPR